MTDRRSTSKNPEHIVEIISDSGEGAQKCGQSFGAIVARMGLGVWTVEIIPAEIRPPARSVAGASGNRIRIGAKRVFLVVSGTMNRTTDEVAKVQAVLGSRHAGTYDSIPPFTPRSAVLQAAQQARDVGTDLVVTFGGGSVTEGGKMVRLCLQHNITDVDGFDRFRLMTSPVGKTVKPKYEGASIGQIAIPTTLSAGELTTGGGAMDERVKRKFSHENPQAIPRTVIFDPAPTVHTPLWVWLSTGVRAIGERVQHLWSSDVGLAYHCIGGDQSEMRRVPKPTVRVGVGRTWSTELW